MFLSIDTAARAILASVQVSAFPPRHLAVSFGGGFFSVGHGLLAFEPSGFSTVQLTAAHALTDAPLLVTFAPGNSRCALREDRDAHAKRENNGQYHTNNLLHAVLQKGLKLVVGEARMSNDS